MARTIPIDPVLEQGYNVRILREDFEAMTENWTSRSQALRASADRSLDCAYDSGARDKLDIFRCSKIDAPLFAFIHGGYWQRGDKSIYSFVAEPFLASGANVAIIGYELCPNTDLPGIVDKMRKAIGWLWQNSTDLGVSSDRINVSGHSAGGHLTAMLLATRWDEFDTALPADVIKTGIPISGLYQLEPLRQTTIGDALQLNDHSCHNNSPQFLRPVTSAPVLVTLGGSETPQFHSQTDQLLEEWSRYGVRLEHHIEPGVDHFDVINRLADGGSKIFQRTRSWLR